QQPLDVLGEQVSASHAERRKAVPARAGVGCVLDLIEQAKERLGLDVQCALGLDTTGDLVVALEEEVVQMLECLLTSPIASPVDGLVEVLRRPIVARVLRIPESIREAM